MAKLEVFKPGGRITGIIPGQPVAIVDVQWRGQQTVELTYRTASGEPATHLLHLPPAEDLGQVQPSALARQVPPGSVACSMAHKEVEALRRQVAWATASRRDDRASLLLLLPNPSPNEHVAW